MIPSAAIVQNNHLAVLAERLHLEKYALYAHGSDLCHTYELNHAMANCFEALMGAIFVDSNVEVGFVLLLLVFSVLGHIERMEGERLVKMIFRADAEGDRERGRPKRRWIDETKGCLNVRDS